MYLDLAALGAAQSYHCLMALVVPRPIAFVTTLGAGGVVNAAPFSSFVALSPAPPIVGFVVGGWEGRKKDTLANIERTGEFVVNIVDEPMAGKVQRCAEPLPPDESELVAVALETVQSKNVSPPRVAVAPVALECRLHRIECFGDGPDRLIAGAVVSAYLRDDLWKDERIHAAGWAPLGRLGGGAFCRVAPLPRGAPAAEKA